MMICHLSSDKPNGTILTISPFSRDTALKEAMQAAQSASCVFDQRIIAKLTRATNEENGVDAQRRKRTNGFPG